MKSILISFSLAFIATLPVFSQSEDTLLYKQVDSVSLHMVVTYPAQFDAAKSYPAIVFFFGGGWNGGRIGHFEQHARYFASRGMICFRAFYRVKAGMTHHLSNR